VKESIYASVAFTATGYSWLSTANEVAQLVAAIVAIIAGVISIFVAIKKWRKA
jgi:hypothetical protein